MPCAARRFWDGEHWGGMCDSDLPNGDSRQLGFGQYKSVWRVDARNHGGWACFKGKALSHLHRKVSLCEVIFAWQNQVKQLGAGRSGLIMIRIAWQHKPADYSEGPCMSAHLYWKMLLAEWTLKLSTACVSRCVWCVNSEHESCLPQINTGQDSNVIPDTSPTSSALSPCSVSLQEAKRRSNCMGIGHPRRHATARFSAVILEAALRMFLEGPLQQFLKFYRRVPTMGS